MKNVIDSIGSLKKAVKRNKDLIYIHKLVVKKFPSSTVEVGKIEDGSTVFYVMQSSLITSKITKYIMIN